MRYHLTGRAFVGPLRKPRRNETVSRQSNSLAQLEAEIPELASAGFRVWLYEQVGSLGDLHVIARYSNDGKRLAE